MAGASAQKEWRDALISIGEPPVIAYDQSIPSGRGDWYYKQLEGQWMDSTGGSEGVYVVLVSRYSVALVEPPQMSARHRTLPHGRGRVHMARRGHRNAIDLKGPHNT
jgi:hypothetical protein